MDTDPASVDGEIWSGVIIHSFCLAVFIHIEAGCNALTYAFNKDHSSIDLNPALRIITFYSVDLDALALFSIDRAQGIDDKFSSIHQESVVSTDAVTFSHL